MSKEFREQQKKKFIEYLERESTKEVFCKEHNQLTSECDDTWLCELINRDPDDETDSFDLRAQDVNDWAWVQEFIPELIIYSAGGQFPFQAQGFLKGFHFYFRTEDGYASMRVADTKKATNIPTEALYSAYMEVDNKGLTGKEWVSYLFTLIEKLERTEKLYFFQTNKLDFGIDGNTLTGAKTDIDGNILKDSHCVWAKSADEAWSNLDYRQHIKATFGTNHYDHWKDIDYKAWKKVEDRLWSDEMIDKFVEYSDIQPIVVDVEGDDREYPDVEPVFEVKVPELWRKDDGTIEIPIDES